MKSINKNIIKNFIKPESNNLFFKLLYYAKETENYQKVNQITNFESPIYMRPFFKDNCCIAKYPN